jgi:hypothetical protein
MKNEPVESEKDNKELEDPAPEASSTKATAPEASFTKAAVPEASFTKTTASEAETARDEDAVNEQKKEEKPREEPEENKDKNKDKDKPKIRAIAKKPKPRKPKPQIKKISSPLLLPQDALKRKNALELKKEAEDAERKLLEQEEQWETPAYLRK